MSAPRMAAANSFQRQPKPLERSVFFKCFEGILAAGRRVAALGAKQGADDPLVNLNKGDKRKRKDGFP